MPFSNREKPLITFFFFCVVDKAQDTVQVETFLRKIGHKKRKEVSCPIMQVSFGTSQVHVNPGPEPPPKVEAVSIVTDELRLRDGTQVRL